MPSTTRLVLVPMSVHVPPRMEAKERGIITWSTERVLGFGFWVLGFGFWVLGFGFWVLGFGVKAHLLLVDVDVLCPTLHDRDHDSHHRCVVEEAGHHGYGKHEAKLCASDGARVTYQVQGLGLRV
jgi:hypothetical protein